MVPDDLAGLRKLSMGFISSRVILTANNLGIFENLKKASSVTEDLMKAVGLTGVKTMLDLSVSQYACCDRKRTLL